MLEEGQDYSAPIWLGEFGTNSQSTYWKFLIRYLKEKPDVHWAYWAYNGYKSSPEEDETFGILNSDMKTVRHQWKLNDLQSVQELNSDDLS